MTTTIQNVFAQYRVASAYDLVISSSDTYYEVFYADETTPTERCYNAGFVENNEYLLVYGYNLVDKTWFASEFKKTGEFCGGDFIETDDIPADIRAVLFVG